MYYKQQCFKVSFLLHVWANGGFLPALVEEEMYKCDTMIAFNLKGGWRGHPSMVERRGQNTRNKK